MSDIVAGPAETHGAGIRWPEVIAGVALNLVPIIGVLFWHWSPFALIFLYWLENVVIGVRTLVMMLISGFQRGPAMGLGSIALGAFFTFHYGMFCSVHGMFVITLFGGSAHTPGGFGMDPVGISTQLFASQANLAFGFATIVIWQMLMLGLFILRGEAARSRPSEIMGQPYGRIIILHVTILLGGFVLMSLGWPIAGVVLLALFKALADVGPALGLGARTKTGGVTPPSWPRAASSSDGD